MKFFTRSSETILDWIQRHILIVLMYTVIHDQSYIRVIYSCDGNVVYFAIGNRVPPTIQQWWLNAPRERSMRDEYALKNGWVQSVDWSAWLTGLLDSAFYLEIDQFNVTQSLIGNPQTMTGCLCSQRYYRPHIVGCPFMVKGYCTSDRCTGKVFPIMTCSGHFM